MKMKARKNEKEYFYHIFCILVGIIALFPVSCNYIMSGGIVTEWIARVAELGAGFENGRFYLFPQAETLLNTGIQENRMNSNLWFFFPGLLYRLSGSAVFTYRIYMVLLQAGTLLTSALLFRRVFRGEEGRIAAFYGILLYMTCPYRIYVCYDLANLSQATAWMLLPLYVYAVIGVLGGEGRVGNLALAAVSLAGIGYADVASFVIVTGVTLLLGILLRKLELFPAAVAGGLLFLPGLYRLARYLFLDGFGELEIVQKSIMQYGYRLGYYFNTYVFREGYPGMGLGMMLCLLAGMWMRFVGKRGEKHAEDKLFLRLAFFLAVLSFYRFPWDLVQRLGGWALRLISLIGTPAVFWGMAQLCLCVPAARFVHRIRQHDDRWVAAAVPVIILLACVAVCVYQCNVLTYNRLPMDIW